MLGKKGLPVIGLIIALVAFVLVLFISLKVTGLDKTFEKLFPSWSKDNQKNEIELKYAKEFFNSYANAISDCRPNSFNKPCMCGIVPGVTLGNYIILVDKYIDTDSLDKIKISLILPTNDWWKKHRIDGLDPAWTKDEKVIVKKFDPDFFSSNDYKYAIIDYSMNEKGSIGFGAQLYGVDPAKGDILYPPGIFIFNSNDGINWEFDVKKKDQYTTYALGGAVNMASNPEMQDRVIIFQDSDSVISSPYLLPESGYYGKDESYLNMKCAVYTAAEKAYDEFGKAIQSSLAGNNPVVFTGLPEGFMIRMELTEGIGSSAGSYEISTTLYRIKESKEQELLGKKWTYSKAKDFFVLEPANLYATDGSGQEFSYDKPPTAEFCFNYDTERYCPLLPVEIDGLPVSATSSENKKVKISGLDIINTNGYFGIKKDFFVKETSGYEPANDGQIKVINEQAILTDFGDENIGKSLVFLGTNLNGEPQDTLIVKGFYSENNPIASPTYMKFNKFTDLISDSIINNKYLEFKEEIPSNIIFRLESADNGFYARMVEKTAAGEIPRYEVFFDGKDFSLVEPSIIKKSITDSSEIKQYEVALDAAGNPTGTGIPSEFCYDSFEQRYCALNPINFDVLGKAYTGRISKADFTYINGHYQVEKHYSVQKSDGTYVEVTDNDVMNALNLHYYDKWDNNILGPIQMMKDESLDKTGKYLSISAFGYGEGVIDVNCNEVGGVCAEDCSSKVAEPFGRDFSLGKGYCEGSLKCCKPLCEEYDDKAIKEGSLRYLCILPEAGGCPEVTRSTWTAISNPIQSQPEKLRDLCQNEEVCCIYDTQ